MGWTWAASIALHAVAVSGLGWVALRSIERREAAARTAESHAPLSGTIDIDLPGVAFGALASVHHPDTTGDPPPTAGGAPVAVLDEDKRGRGGDPRVDAPASNLSDRDDRLSRTLDLLDRLDRNQESRLKTNDKHDRQSWEDRRSSKQPTELTFLAEGDGARPDRRKSSPFDPSRGSNVASSPSASGGALGDLPREDEGPEMRTDVGASREGSAESAPGVGVRDGRVARDHRSSAHVMRARPDVVTAAVSVPAARRGRPRDDIDSDQEVATLVRSIVHASTAGGTLGDGHGGSANGGEAGAGGRSGAGSTGRPLGVGNEWWDMGTTDPRLLTYFRRIHAKLDPLWAHAFPDSATLEMKQGIVIFDVTIARDGAASVAWPPRRPSGVPEFDRNCYDAIRRGAPFDPIPPSLGDVLRVRMPFDARNYIVQ